MFIFLLLAANLTAGTPRPVNYDEAKVPHYTLPDPLDKVTDKETWQNRRRPELLKLFQSQMYGHSPARPNDMKFEVTSTETNALGGKATRKEIIIRIYGQPLHLLLYIPNNGGKPFPAFIGINFDGNHTITSDPGVKINEQWIWDQKTNKDRLELPGETTRGRSIGRWEVEKVIARGYALGTIPRADIEPDYTDGWKHGIRGAWLKASGRSEFAPDDWGAIGAWAWSLSRVLDYLETDPGIDAKRVVVTGHSRMGKAALWAGAQDERFAVVISNNSGEGGAALARRCFGETTAVINKTFPHWFCSNFKQYNDREENLPFDQHELIALAAPRPVYVASAGDDLWADPHGEFLSAKNAEPVYSLFGKSGLGTNDMPAVNHPVGSFIGYHIRTGKHDMNEYDWTQYFNYADKHLKPRQ